MATISRPESRPRIVKGWNTSRIWAILAVAAAAVPMLLPSIPMLIDLPGHIASYRVELAASHTPALARYYRFDWSFAPNLGVDLLILPLGRLFGVELATKLIVAAIPALWVAGLLVIARQVHGRVPATSLVALPLAFSYPLTFGFVNSSLAASLAFVAFGLWLDLTRRGAIRLRVALFAIIAPMLLTAHIVGFGVLGLLVGGEALARHARAGRGWPYVLGMTILDGLPLAWPLVPMMLLRTGGGATSEGWLDIKTRVIWLAILLRERWIAWDLLATALVYATAALPLLARRRFAWSATLGVPAILLWLAALGLPTQLLGSAFASVRIIPIAAAITILAVRPTVPLPAWTRIVAGIFFALRLASEAAALLGADALLRKELPALDHIAAGSRVAVFRMIRCERDWAPPRFQHVGSFAIVRRDAFTTDQFAEFEGQGLKIDYARNPELKALPPPTVSANFCPRWTTATPLRDALARLPWRSIDYLWLIDVPRALQPGAPNLVPLWRQGDSAVYRNAGAIAR